MVIWNSGKATKKLDIYNPSVSNGLYWKFAVPVIESQNTPVLWYIVVQ